MRKTVLSFIVLLVALSSLCATSVFAGKAEADAVKAELAKVGVSGDQLAQANAWLDKNADKITKDKETIIIGDLKAAKAAAGNVTDAKQLSDKQRSDIIKYASDAANAAGLQLRIDSANKEAAVYDGAAEVSRVKLNPTSAGTSGSTSTVVKQTGIAVDFTSMTIVSVALAAMVGGAVVFGRGKKMGVEA